MKNILLVMIILLLTVTSVFCGEFEDILKKAEQGDVDAQNVLGWMYSEGEGVAQDNERAIYWYTKSAEEGYAYSQYALGLMYENGQGVTKDYKQAVYWYSKAAKQGHAWAQHNLGLMYSRGEGVAEDYKKTVYWLGKAAEQGHLYSIRMLGWMYSEGQLVTQDYIKAASWYTKAAEQGDIDSQRDLGYRYSAGDGVRKDVRLAAYWYTKAAEQGDIDSQKALGYRYSVGEGVPEKNLKLSAYWYTKAAEQGDADAQVNIGFMYSKGRGVTKDYKQAVYWYTKSAEQGHAFAQHDLGVMYFNGQGVAQNYKLAYVWQSLAVAQGAEDAIQNRDDTARRLSPQQLSEAQDLAAKIQYRIDNPEKQKPSSVSTPAPNKQIPKSSSVADVRWVQQTLKNLGYKPGPVDGLMGARTRDAIIAFQTDISVAPTGVIDEVLVAQLRQISKNNQDSSTVVTGTGFIITNDGYILTCHHVVEDAEQINIIKGGERFQAKLIRSDPNNDLAILKVNGSFPALAFSPHRSAQIGQDVFTFGYPNPGLQGVSAKYTKGTVSSLTGFQDDLRLYQISVPIQPGNSGGPLLDENGNILGVVIAMLNAKKTFEISGSFPQNVNYAVKSLYAQAMIDTMPDVAGKLISPSRNKSNAIENAQASTVMVVCYD